jgi:ankyrin repeat protein
MKRFSVFGSLLMVVMAARAGSSQVLRKAELERLWTSAIVSNDSALVRKLIADGADVNVPFDDGSTVLMGAAQSGQLENVRLLLEAKAAPNASTRDGMTAMVLAAQSGHAGIVRLLLEAGADVNARKADGGTALMDAAFGGHVEVIRTLLDFHADPNVTLQNGSTALMAASGKGHSEIIRGLVQAGARLNEGANGGGTALMEAAYAGHAEAVGILLAAGADSNAANSKGMTALMGAALGGHTQIVEALLAARASVSAKDSRGWSALTNARASANPATVRTILAKADNIPADERSIALGGTYVNEYYSSNEGSLLEMAADEFQKVLKTQPQNIEALEWMGAVEFVRWSKPPTIEQFRKTAAYFKKAVDLDAKDPDRHYWIAAISLAFVLTGKGASIVDTAMMLDDGILHAKKAIELDPQFADAMDQLSGLYRRKGVLMASDRPQLDKLSAAAHQDAQRARQRTGNRPSRFNDQFSRPALPPAP